MDPSVNYRLDVHAVKIKHLQYDVAAIKSTLQLLEEDRVAEREFRKLVLDWMKTQDEHHVAGSSGSGFGNREHFTRSDQYSGSAIHSELLEPQEKLHFSGSSGSGSGSKGNVLSSFGPESGRVFSRSWLDTSGDTSGSSGVLSSGTDSNKIPADKCSPGVFLCDNTSGSNPGSNNSPLCVGDDSDNSSPVVPGVVKQEKLPDLSKEVEEVLCPNSGNATLVCSRYFHHCGPVTLDLGDGLSYPGPSGPKSHLHINLRVLLLGADYYNALDEEIFLWANAITGAELKFANSPTGTWMALEFEAPVFDGGGHTTLMFTGAVQSIPVHFSPRIVVLSSFVFDPGIVHMILAVVAARQLRKDLIDHKRGSAMAGSLGGTDYREYPSWMQK